MPNNKYYKKLKQYYEKTICKSKHCKTCEGSNGSQLGMWYCGKDAKDGIMFVGKTAATNPNEPIIYENPIGILTGDKNQSRYWDYIREVAINKYGKETYLDRICVNNIVKCNFGEYDDQTTPNMLKSCLKNKYIIEEIKKVQPKYIVFMLNNWYKDIIFSSEVIKRYNIQIIYDKYDKELRMPELKFKITIDNKRYTCLLIGHPLFKNKEKYMAVLNDYLLKEN